ncbi:MAG: hypothetical protein QW398_04455 [Desulfurococcaceae archaeon]
MNLGKHLPILLLIAASTAALIYINYLSLVTDCRSIIPLNNVRRIYLPLKYETIVGVYGFSEGGISLRNLFINRGFIHELVLDSSTESYAEVLSRGVDLAIVLVSLIILLSEGASIKILSKVKWGAVKFIGLTLLLIAIAVSIASLSNATKYSAMELYEYSYFTKNVTLSELPSVELSEGVSISILSEVSEVNLVSVKSSDALFGLVTVNLQTNEVIPLSNVTNSFTGYVTSVRGGAYLALVYPNYFSNATVTYSRISFTWIGSSLTYVLSIAISTIASFTAVAVSLSAARLEACRSKSSHSECCLGKQAS